MDDTILNKTETISRCLNRIHQEVSKTDQSFETNFTVQDAIFLNLERAIQASCDLGAHIIRQHNLGIPQTTREIFSILAIHKFIPDDLSIRMQKMVGFRNLLVHEYQSLDMEIVKHILQFHLVDFEMYKTEIINKTAP